MPALSLSPCLNGTLTKHGTPDATTHGEFDSKLDIIGSETAQKEEETAF